MVFYAAFNSISVISRRQLTLFMLSWVSPVPGWALKCLAQGHSHEKTQRIQCGSNPGPLDYESNTPPLSHVGPVDKGDNRINANYVKEVVHTVSTVVFVTNWLKVNAIQENVLHGEIFIALNTFRCILFG